MKNRKKGSKIFKIIRDEIIILKKESNQIKNSDKFINENKYQYKMFIGNKFQAKIGSIESVSSFIFKKEKKISKNNMKSIKKNRIWNSTEQSRTVCFN